MSWERRGQRLYYYRACRDGSRVIKEYVGPENSPEVKKVAKEDAEARANKADLRRAEQERRQQFEVAQAQVVAMGRIAGDIISNALLVSGFHQHCRGPWRKKRNAKEEKTREDCRSTG